MKLIILRNNLLAGLNSLEKAVGINTNLPILKNILMKTDDGKIILVATNLELAIKTSLSGKVIETGEVTVPFSILNSIVKNLNSERISFEQKHKQLVVNTENYEALIQGQDSKDFPIIPSIHSTERSLKIDVVRFRDALNGVAVAAQYTDIRPEISGVYFNYAESNLRLVSTDSFRLAEIVLGPSEVQSTFDAVSFIVPLRTIEELLRVFDSDNGEVEIFVDPNQVLFKTATKEIISRLIDGHFPDYQAIIPKQIQTEVVLGRQELINAVKLISSFSGRGNDVTLRVGENKRFLELFSANSALGENHYKVPVKLKGEKFSIVFNWRFVLDGLRIYRADEIVLGINSSDRPATIRSSSEPHLVYILMPIKA
jgi:DNA polymerase III subunit beta